jgi:hypothetical protein
MNGAVTSAPMVERPDADDPFFRPPYELTQEEQKRLHQRRTALLYLCGLFEGNSLRDVARDTGVGVSTLHALSHRIATAVGLDFALATPAARLAWAEAARRRYRQKDPTGTSSPPGLKPKKSRRS